MASRAQFQMLILACFSQTTVPPPYFLLGGGGGATELSIPNFEKGGSEKNKCLGGLK